ncbi:MAG TPA: cytidylate kinase family protein [Geopsychrobacteraceae bacterium]|nr:cytidylate kinase family protein [Geopsychrobacteraceae bacterium]
MAIITISREMGSGGIPIAHQAAEALGYELINGQRIREIAPQYGLTSEVMAQIDEKPPAFIEKLDRQIELGVHRIQLIVLEQALKGDVIIYGRGGQDLLPGINSVFRVRIIAPFEDRVERWAEREWIDPDLAHSMVRKSDQQRAGFIKYYHDRDWENPLNYDLMINTIRLSFDTAVEMIVDGVKDKNLVESKDDGKKKLKDLIIQKKVQISRLADERIKDIYFNIEVKDGVVTLDGHVYSEEEHKIAKKSATDVDGVVKVIDHLKVVGYRSSPTQDH